MYILNMNVVLILLVLVIIKVNGEEIEDKNTVEARGKGKYALLTNLAILVAAKVGLYKILLGIAFVVSAVKAMVIMAWALAMSKYTPELYPSYKHSVHFFYVAATKLFVLKIVYGIIFYIIITKAWHFVLWLIHYMKKKQHEHVIIDHEPHHGPHHDYGNYGSWSHQIPNAYSPDYGYKPIYDADGSYSVGSLKKL